MSWFKRIKKNITTTTEGKKDIPKGLWYKSPSGNIVDSEQLKANFFVSPEDDYHVRIASNEYFDILFDESQFLEMDQAVESVDIINFSDSKKYTERLKEAKKTSGLNDSIRNAVGKIHNKSVVISCMDFGFIGGSMGSVVGEKISRAVDYSLKHKLPYVLICKSGGARMMESAHSLMQLAKIQAKLIQLSNAKLPYIPVLTDPTFGGVTASFAMVGDIIIAEPGALIGFAGPRVIKETIGKDLPEGFQTSEFVLEHGFIDLIIHRRELKDRLTNILNILMPNRV